MREYGGLSMGVRISRQDANCKTRIPIRYPDVFVWVPTCKSNFSFNGVSFSRIL